MTRIEFRVTFPKSVEVFGWRKNGVKLMRRKSFVETRDTVAAVDVTRVYALPGYCEEKYLKKMLSRGIVRLLLLLARPSSDGFSNLTMMATHAVAVAVRAVGASHQKSWGEPNQHVGAIITNITGIHLGQS